MIQHSRVILLLILLPLLAALATSLSARAQEQPPPTLVITTPTPTTHPALRATPTPAPPVAAGEGIAGDGAAAIAYVVKEGDTLLNVALEVGVDLEETPCLIRPDFRFEEPLVIGDRLDAPPHGVACHAVRPGDTLGSIAAAYDSLPSRIAGESWNRLPPGAPAGYAPAPGLHLRVPVGGATLRALTAAAPPADGGFLPLMLSQPVGADPSPIRAVSAAMAAGGAPPVGGPGRRPVMGPIPADWPYGSGAFVWPLFGWLSQDFHLGHRAIDVAAPSGTLVTAADRGVVLRAGWNAQGYGYFVVVDHNIDYITLYAHLSEVLVEEGQVVAQGQPLGLVGSTGNSTGPHLHFEIRDFGRRVDPIELLMRAHE